MSAGTAAPARPGPAARILLAEDDDVDAEMLRRALGAAGVLREVVRARDGVEALALVRGGPGRPPLARPYVVLLDLRMPRMGGAEALGELRADPATRDLPAFVLTTSGAERHRARLRALGADGYLVKTDDPDELAEIARLLDGHCGGHREAVAAA